MNKKFQNWLRLKSSFLTFSGVKMPDKMAISAYFDNSRKGPIFKVPMKRNFFSAKLWENV